MYHQVMDAKTAARDELWTEREAGHWTDASEDVYKRQFTPWTKFAKATPSRIGTSHAEIVCAQSQA